jgi:methionine-rich copper-binding protein CopC
VAFSWLRRRGLRCPAALAGVLATILVFLPVEVGAHAPVSRTDARASATLDEPPARVRIWFEGPVETMFPKLRVESGRQLRVDKDEARGENP